MREVLTDPPLLTLSWTEFLDTPGSLFLWEAFVTREAKTNSHHGDAGVAVEAFCRALPNPVAANAVDEERVFSLIGAAALRAGWDVPISILAEPCVVIAG